MIQIDQSTDSATRLFRSKVDIVTAADFAIVERMDIGAQQGYDPDDWRSESQQRHILKAIGHAVRHLEIAASDRPDDHEDHLQAATCRLAMALAVSEDNKA